MTRTLKLFLIGFLFPVITQASPCWPSVFQWNEEGGLRAKKILLLPFENGSSYEKDDWLKDFFPVVLKGYFALSEKVTPLTSPESSRHDTFDTNQALEIAKKEGADFLVIGKFTRGGADGAGPSGAGPLLNVSARFLKVAEKTEEGRLNGSAEFPGTRGLADLLVDLAVEAGKAFRLKSWSPKKIIPYKIVSLSLETLRFYTLGRVALDRKTPQGTSEAIRRFEESIRNDFNFTPAYLGLSLASARATLIRWREGEEYQEFLTRARRELEKAKLLDPLRSAPEARKIEAYLAAITGADLGGKTARKKAEQILKQLEACGGRS